MSTDEPKLRLELADEIQKYVSSPANNISKFIFSIINNTKLILLFIKINDIKYLYERNKDDNTPLMIAIKNGDTEIVKEIMLKIKYELCNFCRKNIEEEELKKPINYVDVDLDLEEIMAKLSIKETPKRDVKFYENIINQLEMGGKWPDIDYLENIKDKVGFNEIKDKLSENMKSILNTCPEGKCPDIKKKITRRPVRRSLPIRTPVKTVISYEKQNKKKQQKVIQDRRKSTREKYIAKLRSKLRKVKDGRKSRIRRKSRSKRKSRIRRKSRSKRKSGIRRKSGLLRK